MSFTCKACGRHRAGSAAVEVCGVCWGTQMGRAAFLLSTRFDPIANEHIDALDLIIGEAQNPPPDGKADGSISEQRWVRLRDLVAAAKAYNDALAMAAEPSSNEQEARTRGHIR